jgi:hypothetical protein
MLFAIFGLLMLMLARFVYGTLLYSAGSFDQMLGLVAGVVIGVMIAHGITLSVSLTDPSGQGQVASYTDTTLGNEVLNFTSYHHFIQNLSNFGEDQRNDPTAG